jgi:hypothetical protein
MSSSRSLSKSSSNIYSFNSAENFRHIHSFINHIINELFQDLDPIIIDYDTEIIDLTQFSSIQKKREKDNLQVVLDKRKKPILALAHDIKHIIHTIEQYNSSPAEYAELLRRLKFLLTKIYSLIVHEYAYISALNSKKIISPDFLHIVYEDIIQHPFEQYYKLSIKNVDNAISFLNLKIPSSNTSAKRAAHVNIKKVKQLYADFILTIKTYVHFLSSNYLSVFSFLETQEKTFILHSNKPSLVKRIARKKIDNLRLHRITVMKKYFRTYLSFASKFKKLPLVPSLVPEIIEQLKLFLKFLSDEIVIIFFKFIIFNLPIRDTYISSVISETSSHKQKLLSDTGNLIQLLGTTYPANFKQLQNIASSSLILSKHIVKASITPKTPLRSIKTSI